MESKMNEKKMKIRKIVTLALIIDFFVVLITGIPMIQFLGLSFSVVVENLIRKVHTISGILMGILGCLHIWIELRIMKMRKYSIA